MKTTVRTIAKQKQIALVAHDSCKQDLIRWTQTHQAQLASHKLYATGTTGHLLARETGLEITSIVKRPDGGRSAIRRADRRKKIDLLVFFWDPMNAAPHDPDVKALMRIATVWNIPVAINETTANFLLNADLFHQEVSVNVPDYDGYLAERLG